MGVRAAGANQLICTEPPFTRFTPSERLET
jgi:hypothetical protein